MPSLIEETLPNLEIFQLFLALCWLCPHPPPTRRVGHREELVWILENLWQLTDTQAQSIRFTQKEKKKAFLRWSNKNTGQY